MLMAVKVHDIVAFVRNKMRMEHVYQPLLIRTVAEAGGVATVNQIARAFAAADESQVAFYEKRIREMPLRVLKKHGVVTVEKDVVSLNSATLGFLERTELVAACNERMAGFVAERGDGVWVGMMQRDPVPQSTRYTVLKRDGKCLLCGNGPDDAPLEVDHIVPRSKGGSNDISNLQVLCRPCNQGKSNSDDTDFTKKTTGKKR
jgi:5-methylcytosine-specific restriction endonuclease McrA